MKQLIINIELIYLKTGFQQILPGYILHAGFDWDKFKDWDYRGRISTGPEYQFVKSKKLELAGRLGVSGIYEVIEPENDLNLEGYLGLTLNGLSQKINT